MTPELRARAECIESFDIDGTASSALPFAARLAREHGWDRAYAERVIREYKRFVILAVSGTEPVCPSEDVDAAWHLHLTYTRSYWTRLCGEVLGRPLHHDPTAGGPAEARKHFDMYARTLVTYRETFGATRRHLARTEKTFRRRPAAPRREHGSKLGHPERPDPSNDEDHGGGADRGHPRSRLCRRRA
jgi:hypothetical protein